MKSSYIHRFVFGHRLNKNGVHPLFDARHLVALIDIFKLFYLNKVLCPLSMRRNHFQRI